jgi:hypothetical protein
MDEFTLSYIECSLWSSIDDNEDPLDKNYSIEDISKETLDQIIADCQKFQNENKELLQNLDPSQCGHDFWLTRNHHGAGFWDRGLGNIGDQLTESAHKYGEVDLHIGNDNKIYT